MVSKVLYSSKNHTWCTPQDLFDSLDKEFGFVLDAAATEKTAKCKKFYTPENCGLTNTWDRGPVFCNPPYGRQIKDWVKKAYEESQKGTTVVLLIPVRTCTTYFHDYIYS